MAGNLTDAEENRLLDYSLRASGVYLALFTASPSEGSPGTEVGGGSYARQSVAFSVPGAGASTNTADITFPTASGAWGTIVAVGIMDAPTGGNLRWYGPLAVSKTITPGDVYRMLAGQLSVSLD